MTVDQRLGFLLQSTESLHARVHEQSSRILQQSTQIAKHTEQLQIDADNIRRLALIAAAHENRISDLENGNG